MPVVLSGILAIYGLVTAIIIATDLKMQVSLFTSFAQLGAGLCIGLAALAAGFSIGIAGDAGVRASTLQPRLFPAMMLILIFGEVLGIYGLIVAMIMLQSSKDGYQC